MPSHDAEIMFQGDPRRVMNACQQATAQLGWRVLDQKEWILVIKEVAMSAISTTFPAQLTVSIYKSQQGVTVRVAGKIGGMGPIQSGHLRGQVGNFLNKLSLCVQSIDSQSQSQPKSDIADQLNTLADLHAKGSLSDSEYATAKAKVLS